MRVKLEAGPGVLIDLDLWMLVIQTFMSGNHTMLAATLETCKLSVDGVDVPMPEWLKEAVE